MENTERILIGNGPLEPTGGEYFVTDANGERVNIEDVGIGEILQSQIKQSDDIKRVLAQEPHEVAGKFADVSAVLAEIDKERVMMVNLAALKANAHKMPEVCEGQQMVWNDDAQKLEYEPIKGIGPVKFDDVAEWNKPTYNDLVLRSFPPTSNIPFAEKSEVEELKQRIEVLEHNSSKAKEALVKLVEVLEILNKR